MKVTIVVYRGTKFYEYDVDMAVPPQPEDRISFLEGQPEVRVIQVTWVAPDHVRVVATT